MSNVKPVHPRHRISPSKNCFNAQQKAGLPRGVVRAVAANIHALQSLLPLVGVGPFGLSLIKCSNTHIPTHPTQTHKRAHPACMRTHDLAAPHSCAQVQLVLEYCDKGCLRDALDQGVFMGPAGLNYPAILDSAIDIARAMLHLHCNNVLHMDLKARNVLLASSGTEERGVSCKVSDFGEQALWSTPVVHRDLLADPKGTS